MVRKAAKQGLAQAQHWHGAMYAQGKGVPQDRAEAAKWYRKAAAQGIDQAKQGLDELEAQLEAKTGGVPPVHECDRLAAAPMDKQAVAPGVSDVDAAKAVEACSAALREFPNVPRFQVQLAIALQESRKSDQALALFRKAAEQGYAFAQRVLGWSYYYGRWGARQSYSEAAKWSQRAAEQGDGLSQYLLANMYGEGKGVPKDLQKANHWFRKALLDPHLNPKFQAHAMTFLGWMHETGQGATRDVAEAKRWYRRAASQGSLEAKAASARLDKQAKAEASKQKFDRFTHEAAVDAWVDPSELAANPLVFEDKTVAFRGPF